jgi:hypothetical protein
MAIGKVVSNRFRNEKGNDIYARVSEEPIAGVPGVLLYLAGPDSDTEIHITRQEGLEVMTLLSKILRPGSRRK